MKERKLQEQPGASDQPLCAGPELRQKSIQRTRRLRNLLEDYQRDLRDKFRFTEKTMNRELKEDLREEEKILQQLMQN